MVDIFSMNISFEKRDKTKDDRLVIFFCEKDLDVKHITIEFDNSDCRYRFHSPWFKNGESHSFEYSPRKKNGLRYINYFLQNLLYQKELELFPLSDVVKIIVVSGCYPVPVINYLFIEMIKKLENK